MKRFFRFFPAMAVLLFSSSLLAQQSVPEIPFDSVSGFLKLPGDIYLGEVAGVATNSRGHLFVYTRTGSVTATLGTNRTFLRTGSQLFEFDQDGRYIREIGKGLYGFLYAHAVRVDAQDNIWVVDELSNMVIKFDPEGHVVMTMGRKPEDIRVPTPSDATAPNNGRGIPGDNFNGPTDVAWDAAGNIFVSDGTGNSRVAKFDKNGVFIKSWGVRGSGPGQFHTAHNITVDAQGNVYVADRDNNRIEVFDNDGNFKTQFTNVGTPSAICITKGAHQYLYSSNSSPTDQPFENGEIYKMELDGTILGKFGSGGKQLKEFGSAHALDCRSENELYVGEVGNWRVQKILMHPKMQISRK